MIEQILKVAIAQCLSELYAADEQNIQFQKTRKEFGGDITLVVFPILRASKKSPEQTAEEIGNYLKEEISKLAITFPILGDVRGKGLFRNILNVILN